MSRTTFACALALAASLCATLPAAALADPPANDNYLQSIPVNKRGTPLTHDLVKDARDTREATVQDDLFGPTAAGGGVERTDCNGVPFGKTVWYDFHPDSFGTVELQTAGYDAVIAVYEFDPATSRLKRGLGCFNERGITEDIFPQVEKGKSYTVQIGGVDAGSGPAGGDLQFSFEFFPDTDHDGIFDPLDKCPTQRGDKANGGCPAKLQSTPKLRAAPTATGIQVKSLSVSAPSGARVRVRCRHGCSFSKARTAKSVSFGGLSNRLLPAGAVLEVFVTKAGAIGNYFRYTVSAGNFKRVDRCLSPGSTKPRSCK